MTQLHIVTCCDKAESLAHISVGQRPTKRRTIESRLKALRIKIAYNTQGFQPRYIAHPVRRALPYADMRKSFALNATPWRASVS